MMIYLLNLAFLLSTFTTGVNDDISLKTGSREIGVLNANHEVGLKDLKYLLDNLKNEGLTSKRLTSLGFHKKVEGIYISNEMITNKKPKHWITLTDMGKSSMVSFKTADVEYWKEIIGELKKSAKPQKLKSETSDMAEKYLLAKYRVETYRPVNGVDINLNNLYEVIIMNNH